MSGYVDTLMGANEKVLVIERQHWSTWVPPLILSLILIGIITAVSILAAPFTAGLGYFGLILNVIPLWMFVRVWLDWYNETYIVTNRRIVQTEGVINKSVIDSSLEKINDVVLSQSLVGRIMDYGDLEILTASDIGLNKLHRIQSPVKFKIAMLNAKEAMRDMMDIDDMAKGPARPQQHDIPELIAELDDLRKKGLITDAEFQEKRAKLMSEI
jgi:uncharacterized membrane protein YdbT with pleckstrin-like domain